MKKLSLILFITFLGNSAHSQSIKDLDFLIGEWDVREDNKETDWWEKTRRVARYVLDGTHIE